MLKRILGVVMLTFLVAGLLLFGFALIKREVERAQAPQTKSYIDLTRGFIVNVYSVKYDLAKKGDDVNSVYLSFVVEVTNNGDKTQLVSAKDWEISVWSGGKETKCNLVNSPVRHEALPGGGVTALCETNPFTVPDSKHYVVSVKGLKHIQDISDEYTVRIKVK